MCAGQAMYNFLVKSRSSYRLIRFLNLAWSGCFQLNTPTVLSRSWRLGSWDVQSMWMWMQKSKFKIKNGGTYYVSTRIYYLRSINIQQHPINTQQLNLRTLVLCSSCHTPSSKQTEEVIESKNIRHPPQASHPQMKVTKGELYKCTYFLITHFLNRPSQTFLNRDINFLNRP